MTLTARSIEIDLKTDWLDCGTGAVESGIDKVESGQITRLYYESYGEPRIEIGSEDGNKSASRRVLTLRAVDIIPFTNDTHPTIVFKDADGGYFYLTPLNHVRRYGYITDPEIRQDIKKRDTETVLAAKNNGRLTAIGVDVALAIPENRQMSPHIES